MSRAAILIGVDRTGDLPLLRDAAKGARRVARWALSQGIGGDRLVVLTDENGGSVTIDAVKKAIDGMVDCDDPPDQLIVYFAGHGVNIGYSEYWLLSDAPRNSQAAVNVAGSEVLARYCGIAHVLMVSDACRTAAEGVRAQRITGSEIFPNESVSDFESPVDQFYACALGRPALEVRDPKTSTREFSALYTDALLEGLSGRRHDLLEWSRDGAQAAAFVRPRKLKTWLAEAVRRRMDELDLQTRAIQVPDARITSDPQAWVARLLQADLPAPAPAIADDDRSGPARRSGTGSGVGTGRASGETVASASASLLRSALRGAPGLARGAHTLAAAMLADAVEKTATPFGPDHHETQCGFKVRGARFVEAVSMVATTELFTAPGDVVRVQPGPPQGASVLLVLDSGNGVLLPAVPQFLTALTLVDGELVDVAYEPSANTPRWNDFVPRAREVRTLRSIASASSRNGVFRLEGDDALEIAQRMQFGKCADPSLAVYASYAYSHMRRKDLLLQMSRYMRAELGARFFDLALHAGELDGKRVGEEPGLLSPLPLMTQGWALLGAHRVALPGGLEGLRSTLMPSLWTLFDRSGVHELRAAMQRRDLQ